MNLVLFIPAAAERFSSQTLCNWVLIAPPLGKQLPSINTPLQGHGPLATLRASFSAVAISTITAILEPGRVLYVETPLPNVSAAKRNALLRYAIEDKLSADPAAIHAVIVGKSRYQAGHSIVAAIDTHWFSAMLATLAACQLSPQTVLDMPQALRLLNANGSDKNSIKNTAPKVGVNLQEGAGFAVRDDGYALSFDGATATNPPFALVLALQEFAQQRDSAAESTAVFNLNDAAGAIDLAQWATATRQTLNDAGNLTLEVLALTVATAQSENRKPSLPQMLAGAHAMPSKLGGQMGLFKPAGLLAAAALCVHIGYLAWDNWRLTSARDATQAQMVQLFQKTFPDAKAIVDPALQMQRSLTTLKGAANTSSIGPSPSAIALADAAAILATPSGAAQVGNIAGSKSGIQVDASVATLEMATAVRTRLASSYPDAVLAVKPASDGKTQQLTLTVPFKNTGTSLSRTP